jgi:integrase
MRSASRSPGLSPGVYHQGTYEPAGFTVEEALVKQGELSRGRLIGAKPVKRSTYTVKEVWEEAFQHAQTRAKQPLRGSTASEYRRYMEQEHLPRFGNAKIGAIGAEEIEALIKDLRKRKKNGEPISESTIANILKPLALTFNYAVRTKRCIAVNPMANIGDDFRVSCWGTREHIEWTASNIPKVIDAARVMVERGEAIHPDDLAVEFLLRTALRHGEQKGLQFSCIDFEAGLASIHQSWDDRANALGPVKTRSSTRRIVIPTDLLQRLAMLSLE